MSAYLDHAASTPMRAEAAEAMAPFLHGLHGNPSGSHRWAREARRRLDDARDVVAEVLGVEPGEVVLTSGGTEADNLAVHGVIGATGGRALCSAVEHHAVLDPVLRSGGATVAVDAAGRIDLAALAAALDGDPSIALVSVMVANNELGTVQDLAAVADVVRSHAPGAVVHADAVAAAPWLDLRGLPVDLLSISAHKFGGPKGSGALVVRSGTPLRAVQLGGGQERERRSGTPDVAGAVGLAAALAASAAERDATGARVSALRDRLLAGLLAAIPDAVDTVAAGRTLGQVDRTPGTVHLCIPGIDSEPLLFLLDEADLAASAASSCASGALAASHVLEAIGVGPGLARAALRLSLGWCSTDADVDHALAVVPAAVARLRAGSRPPAPTVGASS
jgi:cysteine desulfurase